MINIIICISLLLCSNVYGKVNTICTNEILVSLCMNFTLHGFSLKKNSVMWGLPVFQQENRIQFGYVRFDLWSNAMKLMVFKYVGATTSKKNFFSPFLKNFVSPKLGTL